MEPTLDAVGVGNAIVDVISTVSDDFIATHGLVKGAMTLIDAERATTLYAAMPPGIEASGGSAANTIAGLANFGERVAYIGKVRDDQLGEVFAHDLRSAGVGFDVAPAAAGEPTARCLIQVTPDAERTMNTFLGISAFLDTDDVDDELVGQRRGDLLRGLSLGPRRRQGCDPPRDGCRPQRRPDGVDDAVRRVLRRSPPCGVARSARRQGRPGVRQRVGGVLAVRDRRLRCGAGADRRHGRALCPHAVGEGIGGRARRRGARRARVGGRRGGRCTGAGDLYASGFLHGLAIGAPLERCAELGSLAAGEIISHVGARPHVPLADLAG